MQRTAPAAHVAHATLATSHRGESKRMGRRADRVSTRRSQGDRVFGALRIAWFQQSSLAP
jgi:hypothetical protein